MKKLFNFFLSFILSLVLFQTVHAQESVRFFVSGEDKGKISSLEKNGTTYVDVQQVARKFSMGVSFFPQSKQAKITAKSFYAILTAPLEEVIVNAQTQKLKAPIITNGGTLMSPVEFFLLPSFQTAAGKVITFQDNAFQVERPFNLERVDNKILPEENLFVFRSAKKLDWQEERPNNHTFIVTFKEARIKRDEQFKIKSSFVSSAEIFQIQAGTMVKLLLGKEAKDITITQQGTDIVLRVAKNPLATTPIAPIQPKIEATAVVEVSSIVAEENPENTLMENPSVLVEEEDDFVEMPLGDISEEKEPELTISPVETPVIKPTTPTTISPVYKTKRIVIDPGHGGKDPGALRGKYREKEWNLAVSLEVASLLKKAGFDVKMTRSDDTFIALSKRSQIANDFKADLFVSIHTNSSKSNSAKGFQVYFRSEKATDKEADAVAAFENDAMKYEEVHYNFVDALLQSMATNEYLNESSKLAGYIRNTVYKQPGIGISVNQNSSIRQANFYVLKGVQSPAVLVEMGYISNASDRSKLANKNSRSKMAKGIYNGIYSYAQKEGWLNK